MNTQLKAGTEVLWLYTQPGGYNFQYWVPAKVVSLGPKRVTIDAQLQKGGTKRVSVKYENLKDAKTEWNRAWQMMICQG